MGDLIPFPVERRRVEAAAAPAPNPDAVVLEVAPSEEVEYVSGAYWFGVRLRPTRLPPAG